MALAALAALPVLALLALVAFRRYRLAGVPDTPEPFDVQGFGHIELAADEKNAVDFYKQASAKLHPMSPDARDQYDAASHDNWAAIPTAVRGWLEQNRGALELFREGTELGEGVFSPPAEVSIDTLMPEALMNLRDFARLAVLESLRLEDSGDYRGAWRWYRAMLRSSRHAGQHGVMIERLIGAALHSQASAQIAVWAARPDVDSDLLRAALDDVRSIDRMTAPLSVTLKAEYLFCCKSLSDLTAAAEDVEPDSVARRLVTLPTLYARGEPEISRRAIKLIWANWLSQCDRPRPERMARWSGEYTFFELDPGAAAASTPQELDVTLQRAVLASPLVPVVNGMMAGHDRERARQAMLELTLCLQLHHREHGEFPETLKALLGQRMPEVPVDPFGRGEAIRYRRDAESAKGATIWSIDLDGVDNGGRLDPQKSSHSQPDLVMQVKAPVAVEKSR